MKKKIIVTGSITKLQKAMGHSSINVSLTYLRGLEIAELKEEDMPMVYYSETGVWGINAEILNLSYFFLKI